MEENRKGAGLGHREAESRRLKGQTERREEEKEEEGIRLAQAGIGGPKARRGCRGLGQVCRGVGYLVVYHWRIAEGKMGRGFPLKVGTKRTGRREGQSDQSQQRRSVSGAAASTAKTDAQSEGGAASAFSSASLWTLSPVVSRAELFASHKRTTTKPQAAHKARPRSRLTFLMSLVSLLSAGYARLQS